MKTKPPYDVKIGTDGKTYIVFPSNHERDEFAKRNPGAFSNYLPTSFGQFDNAYQVR